MVFFALLLLSCTPADPWEACGTAACRAEGALEAFQQDPVAFARTLSDLEEPERVALMRVLADQGLDLSSFCGREDMAQLATSRLCERLQERPHLGVVAKRTETAERRAPGPAFDTLPIPDVAPRSEPGCEGHAEVARQECLFHAAEERIEAGRVEGVEEAIGLCVGAGELAAGCLHHVIATLVPAAPPADAPGLGDIALARDVLASLVAVLGDEGGLYADYFWSLWTYHSFRRADFVTGDLLDLLPEVMPHIHYAASWRLLGDGVAGTATLDSLVAVLDERLAVRNGSRQGITGGERGTLYKELGSF